MDSLDNKVRVKVRSVYQIEVSSECNLRCKYCMHPNLQRPKQHMKYRTFVKALEWVKHFRNKDPLVQREISLTGLGEAIMHPYIVDFIRMSREVIGDGKIVIATNGLLLTEEFCKKVAEYNPRFFVSLHRPEKAAHAIEAAKKYGLLESVNGQAAYNAFDWAGQVEWFNSAPTSVCRYVGEGSVVVLENGDLSICCMDGNGISLVGNLYTSDIDNLYTESKEICYKCHLSAPDRFISSTEVLMTNKQVMKVILPQHQKQQIEELQNAV